MKYFGVGGRCAVNLESLNLPINREEILRILFENGFRLVNLDMITLARECINSSIYRRGARPSEAPTIVDCSSLIKWLYAMRGIWIPRRSIQQREVGEVVSRNNVLKDDVVFTSGFIDYYLDDPSDGVGHVGIATGEGTVIHAAGKKIGVIESAFEYFAPEAKFRGVRRYVPMEREVFTFITPPNREIETSDDFKWVILQSV